MSQTPLAEQGCFIRSLRNFVKSMSQKFALTCNNIGLAGASRLRAECKTADGDTLGTYINLDEHVANIDGTLKFE
ncbi:MAG: CVNH domain-containing protein [Nostoc sp.]|uniref:CVNH domain-containing protein n=1 Tax=Nostoc sp. TaxID=1180 RepID=UPI002FF55CF4